jgi:hypothetical protein
LKKDLISDSGLSGGEGGSGVAIQGWNDELHDASAKLDGDAKKLTISRILKAGWFLI